MSKNNTIKLKHVFIAIAILLLVIANAENSDCSQNVVIEPHCPVGMKSVYRFDSTSHIYKQLTNSIYQVWSIESCDTNPMFAIIR